MTSTSTSEPDLLTVTEVAERFRVHKMTVYRMCEAGTLDAFRVGRSIRIKRESVDNYLTSQKGTS